MLSQGIKKVDPKKKVTIIPKESEAIEHAIKNAKKGSLVVICSDVVPDALALVTKFKEQEAKNLYDFTKDDIPNLQS
jgi:cyanophycin synthetase